jgi:hypothetical protein
MKCGRCGLGMDRHTDSRCTEIVRLERDALCLALEEMAEMSKRAAATIHWVKTRQAHKVLKNDPFYSKWRKP